MEIASPLVFARCVVVALQADAVRQFVGHAAVAVGSLFKGPQPLQAFGLAGRGVDGAHGIGDVFAVDGFLPQRDIVYAAVNARMRELLSSHRHHVFIAVGIERCLRLRFANARCFAPVP